MSIYPHDHRRETEIDRLLYAHAANRPGDLERRSFDPFFGMQVEVLRDVLRRAEKAMQDEGVGLSTRDRVLHRVVCCESPEDTAERLKNHQGLDRVSVPIVDLSPQLVADLFSLDGFSLGDPARDTE